MMEFNEDNRCNSQASLTASMLQSQPWTGDRRGLLAPVAVVIGNQKKTAEMLFRNLDVFPLEKMQASTFQESIQEASKEFVMLANKEMMDILLLDALNSLNGGPGIQPRGITRFRTPN